MIYEIGTISTKANDPKITGKNTLWKNSVTKVSVGQIILIQSGNTIYQNSIRSVESDTQMTLSFPVPVALTDVKYVISITMIGSVSDGVNKATAMVTESYQLMMILNRLMTESGVIKVVLPDGTEMQLRTEKERDRLLDGKFDKTGGVIICRGDPVKFKRESAQFGAFIKFLDSDDTNLGYVGFGSSQNIISLSNQKEGTSLTLGSNKSLKFNGTDVMLAGDYGWGGIIAPEVLNDTQIESKIKTQATQTWRNNSSVNAGKYAYQYAPNLLIKASDTFWNMSVQHSSGNVIITAGLSQGNPESQYRINRLYGTSNTTKDSNGNLKAASPVVKLFADNIELNEESEGVEMEHLGIGHYLIKGVVGFNADGAWGINNGFVIPQDHNGKNMVLIDYEVRPDGDIEVFVFHQQNADMPERFQNKRIKHFDEEGVPVYFENYEPCDVPESRWIDMRVEMPPNSLYNQKQAEAKRLAKIEAERLAQEEAKRAAEEAERIE
ncbi:hypothetical protein [Providencia huaxiensis]|uniref:Phage tail protein C-terminal domain-containing protein n=3 Tax=Providencia TaxID=586 RepID=A0ABU2IWR0_9GAMM|nr:hypothetical protein [Providencia huaxiensis]MDT0133511.1 hypothetical protein [Providencia huaxiensis]MDT1979917.1 hypothetical protein [Providencia huaxiensis]